MDPITTLALCATACACAACLYKTAFVVEHDENVVLQRFGRYHRTLKPGLNFVLPLIDRARTVSWFFRNAEDKTLTTLNGFRIPMRVLRYDPDLLECTTSDNIPVEVDIVVQFQIDNAETAVYNAADLFAEVEDAVTTKLYQKVRSISSLELNPNTIINQMLPGEFVERLKPYGCSVKSVAVQSIGFPDAIQKSTINASAKRRTQEAELDALENENKKKARITQAREQEQRAQQAYEDSAQAHALKLKEGEAASNAKIAHLRAEQEVGRKHILHEEKLEFTKRRLAILNEALGVEAKTVAASADAIPYFGHKLQSEAYAKLGGAGSRLVVAPSNVVEYAARAPIMQATQLNDYPD